MKERTITQLTQKALQKYFVGDLSKFKTLEGTQIVEKNLWLNSFSHPERLKTMLMQNFGGKWTKSTLVFLYKVSLSCHHSWAKDVAQSHYLLKYLDILDILLSKFASKATMDEKF